MLVCFLLSSEVEERRSLRLCFERLIQHRHTWERVSHQQILGAEVARGVDLLVLDEPKPERLHVG